MDIDTKPSNSNGGRLGREFAMSFINPPVSQPEKQKESKIDKKVRKEFQRERKKNGHPVKVTGEDAKEDTGQEKSLSFRKPKLSKLFGGITKGRVVSKPLLKKSKIVVRIPEYRNEPYRSIYFSQAFAEGNQEGNNSLKSDRGMFWA